jgi:hypothetical protein
LWRLTHPNLEERPYSAVVLDAPLAGPLDGEGMECIGCGVRVLPEGVTPCALLGEGPVCPGLAGRIDAALWLEMENAPHREAGGVDPELEASGGGRLAGVGMM